MEIETQRLILRRFKKSDWHDIWEYLSDEAVVKYESYGVQSEFDCIKIAKSRAKEKDIWAVCLKDTGKLIGNVSLRVEPFDTRELGFALNTQYHRKGYAIEATTKLMDIAFRKAGVRRITAACDKKNVASWKLMEHLGMRKEAEFVRQCYFKFDGNKQPIWIDICHYAILRDEWLQKNW